MHYKCFLNFIRRAFHCVLLSALALAGCQYFQKKEILLSEIATKNGFRVAFSNEGEIKGIYIDAEALPFTSFMRAHSGWLIEDKKTHTRDYFRGQLTPVAQNVLIQKGAVGRLNLEMESRFELGDNFIRVTGTVKSLTPEERALDISFQFPVYDKGMIWEGDYDRHEMIRHMKSYHNAFIKFPAPDSALYLNRYQGKLSLYPYAGTADSGKNYGISCAIPPDFPSFFSFNYFNQIFSTTFYTGISPDSKSPGQATVSCIFFLFDPQWGFRDIGAKYQVLFPYFFSPDSQYAGLMMTAPGTQVDDKSDFSSHVLGGSAFKARSFQEYLQLSGIDSTSTEKVFPYISVSDRKVFNLPKRPASEEDALQMFKTWDTHDVYFFQSPESDNSYRTAGQLKEIIKNSNIYAPNQEPLVLLRQFQRSGEIFFPVNPGYHLFEDTSLITSSKYLFKEYLPEVVAPLRQSAGVYVDVLPNWSRLYNFRHEHFRYAQYPLTYHPESLYVCIPNTFSCRELLDSLRHNQNKNGKKLCCGDILPGDLVFAHIGDYVESNVSWETLMNIEILRWFRVACGPKPVFIRWSAAIKTIQEAHEHWNRCMAYGYFPNFDATFVNTNSLDSAIIAMREDYTPILNALNHVQWKPITFASVSNDSLVVERFGTDRYSGVYFTIFNPQSKFMNGIVSISLKPLKLPASTILVNELRPGQRYSLFLDRQGRINTSVSLAPHEVIVFRAEY